jgi:hypothetical protein
MDARSDDSHHKEEIVYQILQAVYDKMNNSPKSISHE